MLISNEHSSSAIYLCVAQSVRTSVRRMNGHVCVTALSLLRQDLVGSSHPCTQYGCVISLILTKKCGHDSPPLEVMSTLGTCILFTLPSVSTFFALPILVYDVSISNKPHLLYRGSISNIGATLSLVLLLFVLVNCD